MCACLLSIEHLKPTKRVLFATIVMGTLLISFDDLPGKILEPALVVVLPLLLGAFISTIVWALVAFPAPTANAPCAERLAVAIIRTVTAHFAPSRGAVARNAAEPTGSDVFGVFFSSFMGLVLYYLLYKVGNLCTFGLAHTIYLIVLFVEEVKPQRHILAATALLATIVFSSGEHPYETLNKFIWLFTVWYIFPLIGLLVGVFLLLTTSHKLTTIVLGWLTSFLPIRLAINLYRFVFRNDMLATCPAPATTVFGRLDGVDSFITSSYADRAFSVEESEAFFSLDSNFITSCVDRSFPVEESETFFSLDSDNAKPKRRFCCLSCC